MSVRGSAHLFDALGGHVVDDLCRHVKVPGGHVAQRDAVLGQQLGQRVDGAAVLQVTHHRYLTNSISILFKIMHFICSFHLAESVFALCQSLQFYTACLQYDH